MAEFRKSVKVRMILAGIAVACVAAIYAVLMLCQGWPPNIPDSARGFQLGALLGLELLLVLYGVRCLLSMRDDTALRKRYIWENDERRKMILQKTGSVGMLGCTLGLGTATVVAGFFSQTVFFTLLGATLFVSLVRGALKLYYMKKY